MSNMRKFNEIYELANNKIDVLNKENINLKTKIRWRDAEEVKKFTRNAIKIATFMGTHDLRIVLTKVKYPNNYIDEKRGKYHLYIDKNDVLMLGKTRNTCRVPIFKCSYEEAATLNLPLSEEFYTEDRKAFIREFNLKFDALMHEIEDLVLDRTEDIIRELEIENEELRKELAS